MPGGSFSSCSPPCFSQTLTTWRRVVNTTDVGQIIDPQGLEGQLNGCLGSGGIDSTLFEETILDRSSGHILNANLIDYKWRTFSQLPPIDNVVFETPFPVTASMP